MELRQNPFSLYDFLGYFTPGAITVYSTVIAYGHVVDSADPTKTLRDLFATENAEIYVPFVLLSYVTGHLISFLSSVTVERYLVWMHGYPSRFLLRQEPPAFWKVREPVTLRLFGHCAGVILLLPISLPDFVLGRGLNLRDLYARQLDRLLANVITERINNVVARLNIQKAIKKTAGEKKETPNEEAYDYFRLIYHYAVEHAPSHYAKMQNYVALYGFLRTLALIFVGAFWVVVWHCLAHPMAWSRSMPLIFGTMFVSYLTYAAFVKFYRRFSLEAMMAVSVIQPTPEYKLPEADNID